MEFKEFSIMPTKLNILPESVSPKSNAKSKKRAIKTKRNTKSAIKSKESAASNKNSGSKESTNPSTENNSSRTSYSGSKNMRASLSEIVMSKREQKQSSDKSLTSSSFCKSRCCSCKPLKLSEEINKFLENEANDIYYNRSKDNKIYQDFRKYSLNKKPSSQENLHLITSSRLNESKYSHNSLKFSKRKNNLESPISSTISQDSLNCQRSKTYIYKCSLVPSKEIPSMSCNCTYCRKVAPIRSKINRNSFSSSQSCPQLDVIKEEDSEIEDFQNKVRQRIPNKRESQIKMTPSEILKAQKTLEDSCADFLNIVCDNIMESVQKSVDTKLKEFTGHSDEKLENLGQKLDKNEEMMKNYCSDIMEKMTQQNETNFQKLYKLIENLMETKTAANQCPKSENTYQDNECQYDEPIMAEEKYIIKEIHFKGNTNENETNNLVAKTKGCDCCQCPIEGYPTYTFAVDKSLSNKTLIVSEEENNIKSNAQKDVMKTGGKLGNEKEEEEGNKSGYLARARETSLSRESEEASTIFNSINKNPSNKEYFDARNISHKPQFPIEQNSIKEISNNNSFPIRETKERENKEILKNEPKFLPNYSTFNLKREQGPENEQNQKFPNFYDNYDTSGYATEPEDNNEHQSNISGRKKLQKKASKQNYNSPSRDHVTLPAINSTRNPDKRKEGGYDRIK